MRKVGWRPNGLEYDSHTKKWNIQYQFYSTANARLLWMKMFIFLCIPLLFWQRLDTCLLQGQFSLQVNLTTFYTHRDVKAFYSKSSYLHGNVWSLNSLHVWLYFANPILCDIFVSYWCIDSRHNLYCQFDFIEMLMKFAMT